MEEFESTLKELVNAKRLSASKMTKLTDIAMKNIEADTKLISILYRTHKTLTASEKINSLYAFDSLARAARHKVNKYNIVGEPNATVGNFATFLLKLEGILEGLFQTMVDTGEKAAKDKSLKILDIWTKGGTFSAETISQLRDVVNGKVDIPPSIRSPVTIVPTPPPPQSTPPAKSIESSTNDIIAQSQLIALLSQAMASAPSTSTAISSISPQLDSSQLNMLQQLAAASQLAADPPPPSLQSGSNGSLQTFGGSLAMNSNASQSSEPSSSRAQNVIPAFGQSEEAYSQASDPRTRNRGRGPLNDRRDPRKQAPDSRRRSRSQSPPRHGNGRSRDVARQYSPPGRAKKSSQEPGLDEFGREIRPGSADSDHVMASARLGTKTQDQARHLSPDVSSSATYHVKSTPTPATSFNNNQVAAVQPVPQTNLGSTSSHNPQNVGRLQTMSIPMSNKPIASATGPGLESFDITLFDFTNSDSWTALGQMWRVTNGRDPTQTEIMQFVTLASSGMLPGLANPNAGMWMQ